MLKRALFLLFLLPLFFCVNAEPANAQGTYEFLGAPRAVGDKFSPKYGIRYNTQGFDDPRTLSLKKINKLKKKRVPDYAIEQMLNYPGSADAIGDWIDSAFDQVQEKFQACGGSLADRARRVSPRGVTVKVMPSAFFEPYYKVYVAGVYYPSSREIKVLNIYYTWSGANKGWLRHAKDLLVWEMGNYIGASAGIQPEPRGTGWPCNAPPLK